MKLFRIPIRQMMWDLNRRDYDLNKGTWVSRTRLYGKKELIAKYPEFKKQIDKMTLSQDALSDLALDATYFKQIIDTELSAVASIEFYERDYKSKFFIVIGDNINDEHYDTKKDAEREIAELMAKYEALRDTGAVSPVPPRIELHQQSIPVIRHSEIAHNLDFVAEEETDLPDFPYDIYYPYFEDGEYWSMMDLYKDPQRFVNKMFSMVDHQISTSQKGLLLIDEKVPEATAKKVIDGWNKTGGAFVVPEPTNFFHYIKPESFDPRLLSAMEVAVGNIERKGGGANFVGSKESSNEAAAAIRQRIERGAVSSFPVFDNFDRFKMSVGGKLAWYLTHYMTAAQKIRIEGEELTELAAKEFPEWFQSSRQSGVGFVEINTARDNTIDGLLVDVIVDKSRRSVTKNQATLAQLSIMLQSSPLLAETVPPQMLIELFDLPASMKRKMTAVADQLMQAKMERDKSEGMKPPSLSASLSDITLLPFPAQQQLAALFGIELQQPVMDVKQLQTMIKMKQDQMAASAELAHKQEKHEDQTTLKVAEMLNTTALEQQKLKHKTNGDA
jgi:hypothetical protein